MATLASKPTPIVPLPKMTEQTHAGVYVVKSPVINWNDASPVAAFTVEPNTLVLDIIAHITAAFDGAGTTVDIGDGTDADGFIPTATLGVALNTRVSMKQSAGALAGGKLYTVRDTIDVTIAPGGGASAGTLQLWLMYKCFDDESFPE